MKNINISDEDYKFLLELKNNLLTQDNRCTRDPFYIIKDIEKIYGMDGDYGADYYWISEDSEYEFDPHDVEDIYDYINDFEEVEFDMESFRDKNVYAFGEYNLDNYEDYIMGKYNFRKIYWIEQHFTTEQGGYFLTEQNALEHLRKNKHRYSDKAYVYADSTWRNEEINKLREIILNIE